MEWVQIIQSIDVEAFRSIAFLRFHKSEGELHPVEILCHLGIASLVSISGYSRLSEKVVTDNSYKKYIAQYLHIRTVLNIYSYLIEALSIPDSDIVLVYALINKNTHSLEIFFEIV